MTSEDDNETVVAPNNGVVLSQMATLDDIDEDEAFINELMAMHPNDDDIVVEDLEEAGVEIEEAEALPDEGEIPSEVSVDIWLFELVLLYRSRSFRFIIYCHNFFVYFHFQNFDFY